MSHTETMVYEILSIDRNSVYGSNEIYQKAESRRSVFQLPEGEYLISNLTLIYYTNGKTMTNLHILEKKEGIMTEDHYFFWRNHLEEELRGLPENSVRTPLFFHRRRVYHQSKMIQLETMTNWQTNYSIERREYQLNEKNTEILNGFEQMILFHPRFDELSNLSVEGWINARLCLRSYHLYHQRVYPLKFCLNFDEKNSGKDQKSFRVKAAVPFFVPVPENINAGIVFSSDFSKILEIKDNERILRLKNE